MKKKKMLTKPKAIKLMFLLGLLIFGGLLNLEAGELVYCLDTGDGYTFAIPQENKLYYMRCGPLPILQVEIIKTTTGAEPADKWKYRLIVKEDKMILEKEVPKVGRQTPPPGTARETAANTATKIAEIEVDNPQQMSIEIGKETEAFAKSGSAEDKSKKKIAIRISPVRDENTAFEDIAVKVKKNGMLKEKESLEKGISGTLTECLAKIKPSWRYNIIGDGFTFEAVDNKSMENKLQEFMTPIINRMFEGYGKSFETGDVRVICYPNKESFWHALGQVYRELRKKTFQPGDTIVIGTLLAAVLLLGSILWLLAGTIKRSENKLRSQPQTLDELSGVINRLIQKINTGKMENGKRVCEHLSGIKNALELLDKIGSEAGGALPEPGRIAELEEEVCSLTKAFKEQTTETGFMSKIWRKYGKIRDERGLILEFIPRKFSQLVSNLKKQARIMASLRFVEARACKPESIPDTGVLIVEMAKRISPKIESMIYNYQRQEGDVRNFKEIRETQLPQLLRAFNEKVNGICWNRQAPGDFETTVKKMSDAAADLHMAIKGALNKALPVKTHARFHDYLAEAFGKINDAIQFLRDDYKANSSITTKLIGLGITFEDNIKSLETEVGRAKEVAADLERANSDGQGILSKFGETVSQLADEREKTTGIVSDLELKRERISTGCSDLEKMSKELKGDTERINSAVENLKGRADEVKNVSVIIGEDKNALHAERKKLETTIAEMVQCCEAEREVLDEFNENTRNLSAKSQELIVRTDEVGAVVASLAKVNEVTEKVSGGLKTHSGQLAGEVTKIKDEVQVFSTFNNTGSGVAKVLEENSTQLKEMTAELGGVLADMKNHAKIKIAAEELLQNVSSLSAKLTGLKEIAKAWEEQNMNGNIFVRNLSEKTAELGIQVTRSGQAVTAFKSQNNKGEQVVENLNSKSVLLNQTFIVIQAISEELGKKNAENTQLAENLKEFIQTLIQEKIKVQGIVTALKTQHTREEILAQAFDGDIVKLSAKAGEIEEVVTNLTSQCLKNINTSTAIEDKITLLNAEISRAKATAELWESQSSGTEKLSRSTADNLETLKQELTRLETSAGQLENQVEKFDTQAEKLEEVRHNMTLTGSGAKQGELFSR
ncbi:MAG: hypothetical protein GY757_12665, partial [bacterium]|nr:hypothetical protein [bacterium]